MISVRARASALALATCVALVAGTLVVATPGDAAPATTNTGVASLNPARILDTRDGATIDGRFRDLGPLAPGAQIDVAVLGRGGVPADGVDSVFLSVTVDAPSAVGYLTVFPTGSARPNASNLNFAPGATVANLVVAKVGANGAVSIYNSAGATTVLADVVGYATTSGLVSLVPARVLDSRAQGATVDGRAAGFGPLTAGAATPVAVRGRGGVPATGVGAVILNVTVNEPSSSGYLTVWPAGSPRPNASNVNFDLGATVANLVVAKVGIADAVYLSTGLGDAHVIADVVGYFPDSSPLTPLEPARLLDTRPGTTTIDGAATGAGPLGPAGAGSLQVAGRGGVPATGAGTVLLNVTATNPTAVGYLTVWPTGQPRPNASNLNVAPGVTVANLVLAGVGADGRVSLFNSAGTTDLLVDVVGWLPPLTSSQDPPPPPPPPPPAPADGPPVLLRPGVIGSPYTATMPSSGGTPPDVWSALGLTPGLAMSTGGAVSGTPTTAGTVSGTATVTDGNGAGTTRFVRHTAFPAGAGYVPLTSGTTITSARPANSTVALAVAGTGGVPVDARAVAIRLGATAPSAGFLTVYPGGASRPLLSSLNVSATASVTDLTVVPIGPNGAIDVYTLGPLTSLEVEVVGYFDVATSYRPDAGTRVLDTRGGPAPVSAGGTASADLGTVAPVGATAALVHIIASSPAGAGSLTAWSGDTPPGTATMRWRSGEAAPDQFAVVPFGAAPTLTFGPQGASTHVIVDVIGYFVTSV